MSGAGSGAGSGAVSGAVSGALWLEPRAKLNQWVVLGDGSEDYLLWYLRERKDDFDFPYHAWSKKLLGRVFRKKTSAGLWYTKLKIAKAVDDCKSHYSRKSYPDQGSFGVVGASIKHPDAAKKIILDPDNLERAQGDPLFFSAAQELVLFAGLSQFLQGPGGTPGFGAYRLYTHAFRSNSLGGMHINARITFDRVLGMDLSKLVQCHITRVFGRPEITIQKPDASAFAKPVFGKQNLVSCALVLKILSDILRQLDFLFDTRGKIVHLDIKLANTMLMERDPNFALLFNNFVARLVDLGAAKDPEACRKFARTPMTTARDPRSYLTEDQNHGPWVDMFSLGVMMAEFFSDFNLTRFHDVLRPKPEPHEKRKPPVSLEIGNDLWIEHRKTASESMRATFLFYGIPDLHAQALLRFFLLLSDLDPASRLKPEFYLPVGLYLKGLSELLRHQGCLADVATRDFTQVSRLAIPEVLSCSPGAEAGAGQELQSALEAKLPDDIDDDWGDASEDPGPAVSATATRAALSKSQTLENFIARRKTLGLSEAKYMVTGFRFLGQLLRQLHQQYETTENSANFHINETSIGIKKSGTELEVVLGDPLPAADLQFYPDPDALWTNRTEYFRDDLASDAFSLGVVMLNYFGLVNYQEKYEAGRKSKGTQEDWKKYWVERVSESIKTCADTFIESFKAADHDFCEHVEACFGIVFLLAQPDPKERIVSDFYQSLSKYLTSVTGIINTSLDTDSAGELYVLCALDIPEILEVFITDPKDSEGSLEYSEDSEEEICGGGTGHAGGAGAGFSVRGDTTLSPSMTGAGAKVATAFRCFIPGALKRKSELPLGQDSRKADSSILRVLGDNPSCNTG